MDKTDKTAGKYWHGHSHLKRTMAKKDLPLNASISFDHFVTLEK